MVCTPHLGAATTEAQENVALQVAEQMSDYLLTGAVTNALNMPSVTAEEAKVMGPWIKLAGHLGNFIGQMTDEPIKAINILYDGVGVRDEPRGAELRRRRGHHENGQPGCEHGLAPR